MCAPEEDWRIHGEAFFVRKVDQTSKENPSIWSKKATGGELEMSLNVRHYVLFQGLN